MSVYEICPKFCSERFLLRQTSLDDCDDLLNVYSDTDAVPIFNSDNCTGDFYITRKEDMVRCIEFWQYEYTLQYYVRWSIIDRQLDHAVGTIEFFHRTANDFYNHVGLLRLDLRSDYENEEAITEILSLLIPPVYDLFDCSSIATKIPACAKKRVNALHKMGFRYSPEPLYGHDGTAYGDYYILEKH